MLVLLRSMVAVSVLIRILSMSLVVIILLIRVCVLVLVSVILLMLLSAVVGTVLVLILGISVIWLTALSTAESSVDLSSGSAFLRKTCLPDAFRSCLSYLRDLFFPSPQLHDIVYQ